MFEFDDHFDDMERYEGWASVTPSNDESKNGLWTYLGNQVWTLDGVNLHAEENGHTNDWSLFSTP
ncbi:MAG: hypothetical protein R3E39_12550 [Anaerolineae bacterium]